MSSIHVGVTEATTATMILLLIMSIIMVGEQQNEVRSKEVERSKIWAAHLLLTPRHYHKQALLFPATV